MKKIFNVGIILIICICFCSQIYATGFLNDVFEQADSWRDGGNASAGSVGTALSSLIGTSGAIPIFDIIFTIGNLVIFVVTIVLGLKYIYSGIDGKADIKGALPNFAFGIVFFYLANAVYELSSGTLTNLLGTGDSYENFAKRTYYLVNTIANTCAILGIVLVGLKYMFTNADRKADVKKQLIPVVVGIILVYCTLKVIMLVYNIGSQMIT